MFLAGLFAGGTAAAAGATAATAATGATAAAATGSLLTAGATATGIAAADLSTMAVGSTIAAGATSGFSWLSALSTGLTLASAGSSLFGGLQGQESAKINAGMQADALEFEAKQDMLDMKAEEIRGKQETNQVLDDLRQTIAAQRVAAGANGLDFTFGTPESVTKSAGRLANAQLSTLRSDAQMRVLARRRARLNTLSNRNNTLAAGKASAREALMSGVTQAAGSVGSLIDRTVQRG